MIDLRSDTVTKPTPAMRRAMYEAEVGDDVYGEDPTVNLLEARAAEVAGKEAAMFVPSGTMGNTIAIKLLTEHGQEVICDSRAHLFDWELSMLAWFSGCQIRSADAPDGILTWDLIREVVRAGSSHASPTGAIEIENTHNMAGGLDAAGLVALEDVPGRVAADRANAQLIARRLARIDGIEVRPVETNIVIFDPPPGCSPRDTASALKTRGVLMNSVNDRFMRA